MQQTKNIRLLATLAVLVIIITLLKVFMGKDQGLDIDKRAFTLDAETVITDVSITARNGSVKNEFSFVNGGWTVNNRYSMDRNMRDVFFSVLSQMEIRRPVEIMQSDSIEGIVNEQGFDVVIKNNGDLIKEYVIIGDEDNFLTYVQDKDKQLFEMHIPGYQSYLAGIFAVPENDWRNRLVFSLNPVSLAYAEITFADETYRIEYDNNQFNLIDGVADSTELTNFMEAVVFLEADTYFNPSERPELAAHIKQSTPEYTVRVVDITGNSEQLELFPKIKGNNMIVGLINEESTVTFDERRLRRLYRRKDDF